MKEPPWDKLTPGSRSVMNRLVYILANGFTGQLILECNQGGVKYLQESRRVLPEDLVEKGE